MKPTQEQVLDWARIAGLPRLDETDEIFCLPSAISLANFAYEAGRKDENEACAELVEGLRRMKLEKGFVCDCGIEDATWDLIEAIQEKTDGSH